MNNTITTHQLKTVAPYFCAVLDGTKTFEFRYDDRGYKVGDILILKEYRARQQEFTGRKIKAEVTYVLSSFVGMEYGYIVMGIKLVGDNNG